MTIWIVLTLELPVVVNVTSLHVENSSSAYLASFCWHRQRSTSLADMSRYFFEIVKPHLSAAIYTARTYITLPLWVPPTLTSPQHSTTLVCVSRYLPWDFQQFPLRNSLHHLRIYLAISVFILPTSQMLSYLALLACASRYFLWHC